MTHEIYNWSFFSKKKKFFQLCMHNHTQAHPILFKTPQNPLKHLKTDNKYQVVL